MWVLYENLYFHRRVCFRPCGGNNDDYAKVGSIQILEEVRRPDKDPHRVYRRGAIATLLLVTFFYMMVNVAFVSITARNPVYHL